MIKAALLDAQNNFIRMDELADEAQLTDRHLPAVTECDLPAHTYRWVPDADNPYGGAFWPLEWLELQEQLVRDMAAAEHRRNIARTGRPPDRRERSARNRRP